jgi:hypothetical protein
VKSFDPTQNSYDGEIANLKPEVKLLGENECNANVQNTMLLSWSLFGERILK